MSNAGRAAIIMSVLAGVEIWPLALMASQTGGVASLERALGWGAAPISPLAWVAALVVALGYAAASMTSLAGIRRRVFTLNALKLLGLAFALITGTFEEIFFRQWVMNYAQSIGFGLVVQVVASGVIFGVAHGFWGLFGGNIRAALSSMLFTTVMGAALAGVYILAGRHVAPCVWSHILINLIIEPWLLVSVLELRNSPVPAAA